MINFSDLHRVTPSELRITATDDESGRSKVYPIFVKPGGDIYAEMNAVAQVKIRVRTDGLPPAYDAAADAAALRAEYNYPNHFRKAP